MGWVMRSKPPARRFQLPAGTLLDLGAVADGEYLQRSGTTIVSGNPGGGSGDSVTVNGVACTNADFDDATPAAPAGDLNIKWQKDGSSPTNISGYVDVLDLQALLPYLTTTAAATTYEPIIAGTQTDGYVATIVAGTPTWAAPTGTTIGRLWSPWTPPASPHAMDDEFDDSSFDLGKWTDWDVPGFMTLSEDSFGAKMVIPVGATLQAAGFHQGLSSADDEWEIRIGVSIIGPSVNQYGCGILLANDLAGSPSTADFIAGYQINSGTGTVNRASGRWNAYNSFAAGLGAADHNGYSHYTTHMMMTFKVSTNKASLWWLPSTGDGGIAHYSDLATGLGVAPSRVGVMAYVQGLPAGDAHFRIHYFRVRSGASGIHNVHPTPAGGLV